MFWILRKRAYPNVNFEPDLVNLLDKMFLADPAARITAEDALNHPWLTEKEDGTRLIATRDEVQSEL